MANISAIKVGSTSYGITPASHASTATTYGAATASNYGHVKLSDNYTSSAGAASSGIGASSLAVYNAYNTLNSKFVLLTGNLPSSYTSVQTTISVSSYPSSKYLILAAQCWANGANCYYAVPIDGWSGGGYYCYYDSDTTILLKVQSGGAMGSSYKIILYKYA